MRKLLSLFLLLSMFVIPVITSCVPGGYEGDNPNRPSDEQAPVEGGTSDTSGGSGSQNTTE
jgi:hypothetical protein